MSDKNLVRLRPIIPDPDRAFDQFGVFDIESFDWINFLVIGYYTKVYEDIKGARGKIVEQIYSHDILKTFRDMKDFCRWMMSDKNPHKDNFAHFGGRFDFQFLLKEYHEMRDDYFIHNMIARGSGLLCFSVSTFTFEDKPNQDEKRNLFHLKNGKWVVAQNTKTFWDSGALLPFSLASLTKNFNVTHKKLQIDYEQITEVTPELIEYLEHDLYGLHEILEAFYKSKHVRKAGGAKTLASQALRVFQTTLEKPLPSLTESVDRFVRSSYFGGRTEIFKPVFIQNNERVLLKSFDVNSLYPAVMMGHEYPGYFDRWTNIYEPRRMGFYDVTVYVPPMYVPPLGTVFDPDGWGRFIFPTGTFRGKWSSVELNYALTCGVKILEVHQGALFKSVGRIFDQYIGMLYKDRKESAKDSVDNMQAKLLMNSLYGRFGIQRHRESLDFDNGELGVQPFGEIEIDENRFIRLVKKEIFLEKLYSNVAISAWVTSLARIHMHKLYTKAPEALYYTDTDSIQTTHNYSSNANELGELKYEYKSVRACFLLPKTYYVETTSPDFILHEKDGKKSPTNVKCVMKGFGKTTIGHFGFDHFYDTIQGEIGLLKAMNPKKMATFRVALNNKKFLMLLDESPREVRAKYDKRRIIEGKNGQPFDTEPLHIENGVIVNKVKREPLTKPRRAR